MMTHLRKTTLSLAALVLALATSGTASAQTTPQSAGSTQSTMGSMQGGMHGMQNMKCDAQCMKMHMHMKGMHTMQATVTSADTKTGIVEVNADGMALRLHFPGLSSGDLKPGDKITVMMAYSKP